MEDFGRILIALGVLLIVAGGVLLAAGRVHFPLGRLPGDFLYRGKNTTVYFPLATSIVLSVVISAVLMLVAKLKR